MSARSSGLREATSADRPGRRLTSPSLSRRRSASRTGMWLTSNCSHSSTIDTAAPGRLSPLRIARCSSSVTRSTKERWAIGRTGAPVRVRAMRFSPSSAVSAALRAVPTCGQSWHVHPYFWGTPCLDDLSDIVYSLPEREVAMVDPTTFRDVMAQWPSGVTVVTTLVDGAWHGMTASSFSSVSLDPPLVSVCLDRRLYSHGLISSSGVFGINVLAKDQAEVARVFAGMVPGVEDRFAGESWTTAETGTPLLDSALGWLDCRVVHEYPGGDHTIFVGEVVAGHAAPRTAPLLFHSRSWGQFADVLPTAATLADGGLVAALRARDHSEEEVLGAARDVAASGVRVRVLDLTRDEPPVGVPEDLKDRGTALVETIEQRDRALELGLSTVE